MSQLKRVELEDGTIIMIEADENVNVPDMNAGDQSEEESLVSKGGMDTAIQQFKSIEGTIRAYTDHVLNSFREIAVAKTQIFLNDIQHYLCNTSN